MKKYWWILLIIIILVIGYFIFFNSKKVEYTEFRDESHFKGDPESSVVLIEYSDFQCPACGLAASYVKDLLEVYQERIKFEFRHFPLTSIHHYAFKAAEASECAADQNKFWEYYDILFLNQNSLTKSDLTDYANQIKDLNSEIWQDCLNSRVKIKRVEEDITEANKLGYNSTPTFVLNAQQIDDWQNLSEIIKDLLEPLESLQKEATTTQSYLRNVKFSS